MMLFLNGKRLRRSRKPIVENRIHQSKQFGELLSTANGFTLTKTKYRDVMDGYCVDSTETEK